ncbi:BTB/POZ domain-containing protein 6-B-like isoform X2 [Periplaneta americana]|uniref:BTB/POZ domain-containing protein 6-B-like isoform X2 n=1 Tax=Periplaneta americana TaxID=6978 RepID=UPI0037E8489A
MDNKLSLEASAGGEACDTITNEKVQQSEKKNKGNVETAGVPKGSNFKERGLSALECGLWVDCKFLVGEDEEEIEACSIVLSLASPVFAAMFFGSMPEKEPVKVPDVEPEVFQLLLQFIYAHEVQISSNEEAAKLMVAADKYMLPDLIKTCSEFFTQNINGNDMKDLCDMLNTATLFNREDMKKVALKFHCAPPWRKVLNSTLHT